MLISYVFSDDKNGRGDIKAFKQSFGISEIVEIPIHIEMYRARVEISAVVHTHQTYATLMGTLGLKLELLDPNTLAMREWLHADIRSVRQAHAPLILKAHGPVIVGKSVEEACMLTIALENAAKAQMMAAMIGGSRPPIESLGIASRTPSPNLWRSLIRSYL